MTVPLANKGVIEVNVENGALDSVWVKNGNSHKVFSTVHAAFEAKAAETPDAIALEIGGSDETLTYGELNERANALAYALIADGVSDGEIVCVQTDRSFDLVIAFLGILKAGGAYLPLDPSYPVDRLQLMAEDSGAARIVTSEGLAPVVSGLTRIGINSSAHKVALPDISPEEAAYIIYTSGSTGRPKGVITPHRGIARLVLGADYIPFGPERRFLQLAPTAFDAATLEIWGPLLNGGTCVIYPRTGLPDFKHLASVLKDARIDTLWLTSSLFNAVIDSDPDALSGLQSLLVGGEALSVPHVRRALDHLSCDLINGYGPTETTTFACTYPIPRDLSANASSVPIGQPINATSVAILDEDGNSVAPGETGELCIAGAGVALGYLNRPEITAERFLPMPGETHARYYRTGDVVHMNEDGNIVYIGRLDSQVKLSGHRIELGEIETALKELPEITDAAVIVDGGTDIRRLAAFIVGTDKTPDDAGLRDMLGARLPEYMVPAVFERRDALPLTENGKLDRKALKLSKRARPALSQAYVAPKGTKERFIAATWEQLLDVEGIGRNDRFFELGGTSLAAMRFIEICRSEKGFDLSVAAFFDQPTIENLARIWSEQTEIIEPVTRAPAEAKTPGATDNAEIAIVGIAARAAGADTADELWDLISQGKTGRIDVTAEDMIASGKDPAIMEHPDFVGSAYPLNEHDKFDIKFFGFTPREVELMDPQQRIMLEAAWMALEDAGHDTRQGTDRIGVFGGVGRNAYQLENLMSVPKWRKASHDYQILIGNERDFPSTHIAYRMGLTGPALTVQTACSTSGTAIHMAAESLRRGECDMALAGGAKFLVPHRAGYVYIEGGPLTPTGKIRAFDAKADGMIRGSGVAMLALKRLDEALEDGDHIYAKLIGSALNNDGENRAGFTAPSSSGQAGAIAEAYARAGVEADTITMIEAHGTGTLLGDPIEIEGLTRAFRQTTDKTGFCAIGSIKTNTGHLDAGATAAGVVKAALALKNELIPPSINFDEPNPRIPFETSPFYVASKPTPWKREENAPRRAGISSFGLGGTNAHIVIEEAPIIEPSDPAAGPQLFVLSARTDTALERRANDLADWLEAHPDANLADVAYTLVTGRRRMEKRLAFVAHDHAEAIAKLRARNPRELIRSTVQAEEVDLAFLFAGGGAQYAGMAMGLYDWAPAFRAALDLLDAHYKTKTGDSLIEIIRSSDTLETPTTALPALFAVEYAMAKQWEAWGAKPAAMIGHSMGEYAAACMAGVFSPEHGLDIVIARGRLFDTLPEGGMLSVPMGAETLEPRLDSALAIAAINAEGQCVVSGPVPALEALAKDLEAEDIETRRVHINVAAHSPMVEPILEDFRAAFDEIDLSAPTRPFVSNVTGTWITDEDATDPDYWVRHLRSTVRFADGAGTLLEDGDRLFLELGPGQVLSTLTRQHSARGASHEISATIRHPSESDPDADFLLNAVGKAWMSGAKLDWKALWAGRRLKVPLPVYRFERQRAWIDAMPYAEDAPAAPTPAAQAQAADIPAETVTTPVPVEATPEPEAPAAPVDRRAQILAQAKAIINDLSGVPIEEIDEYATFLELGFDSLFLTQANAAFKKAFKIKLNTRQLIEELPVLDAVAAYIDENGGKVDGAAAAPAPATAKAPAAPAPAAEGTAPSAAPGKTAAAANVSVPTIDRTEKTGLTPAQDAHIDAVIAETIRRTPKAKENTQKTRRHLADPRTVQGFKSRWKEMVYPILSDKAKGSRVWDIDGNEYIDLVGGYGVTFLGHQPDFVVDAIREQSEKSLAIGPQTVLAGEVAEMISDMTGMERVAFCNTGSEAVLAAVRMARTVTGNSKVVKFDGHYHGIFDEMQVRGSGQGSRLKTFPSAPGIPQEAVENTIILDYGNPDAFDVIRENAEDIALVLVEPVRSRNPDFQPIEYVQELRRLTEELGIPLLFDEIVTGFRCHPKGAQHVFGIRADIATYGKVIGGGLPIGVVAGSSLYMDTLDGGFWEFGDDSVPTSDMTWFAGTFVRHPMALATTRAVLNHLKDEGPALQDGMTARAKVLVDELNDFFTSVNVPLKMEQFSSVLRLTFTEFNEHSDLLFFHLRNRGIMTYEGRPIFLSAAHTAEDLARVRDAMMESVNALIEVGLFKGTRPDGSRVLPLAPAQQEIWFASQFSEASSCSYNLCSTIELKGPLNRQILQSAITALTERHEALRAVPDANGETQTIRRALDVPFKLSDFSLNHPDRRASDQHEAEQAEVTVPFDMAEGPLIRAHLMKLDQDHHKLLLTVHHVIADGFSCGIMVRELGELYAALRDDRAPDLPAPLQLTDYLAFLSQPDTLEAREEAREYWLDLHKDGLRRVEFPSDRPRPPKRQYAARRATQNIPLEVIDGLTDLAKSEGTTLFSALISGFGAYLTRITGVQENALGFAAAGQPLMGAKPLVSHCVTFLPLKVDVDPAADFATLLRKTGGELLDAMENQNFDFVSFVKEVAPDRDLDWAPVVTVGINLDAAAKEAPFADFKAVTDSIGRRFESLDLFINIVKTDAGAELQCTYNTAMFDEATIQQRMSEFRTFLANAAARADAPVAEIDMLTSDEQGTLTTWAGKRTDYPADRALVDLFRDMVAARGAETALIDTDGATLSYAALDAASDAWARKLVDEGVRPGDFVGLCMARSPKMIVALMAILKAGAAYVPFEVSLPDSRIAYILEDCRARHILSETDIEITLPTGTIRIDMGDSAPASDATLPEVTGGATPAYLMYTSGSTGTPKGVLVPQRGIVRLVRNTDYARFDESRVFLQISTIGFDAATFEIWGALLNGAKLVVPPLGLSTDTNGLRAAIADHGVTSLFLTTALFNTLIDTDSTILTGVDELLTGGEAISTPHVRKALADLPDTQVIHVYGPTENTTFSTSYPIDSLAEDAVTAPIGRPIANTRAYIVDANLRPVPQGVPGELVLAGDGLALGYLNRPELNESVFVAAPSLGEAQIYRTGDFCRFDADGLIEFIGRRDGQIKIRGFRVEPGEIEAALAGNPKVDQAAVIYNAEKAALFGFYVETAPTDPQALLADLRDRLPRHMVPARLIRLDSLPVTPNGKLNRAELTDKLSLLDEETGRPVPATSNEVGLAAIWRRLLGVETIYADDDFFELGGHSLMAVQLFDRIENQFGPKMPISTLFGAPTIQALGAEIEEAQSSLEREIDPSAPWDTSVVIHEGPDGRNMPLFIVGGGGGNVNNLAELGRRVGERRKVVAFQTRGVLGHAPHSSVEDVARENLSYLRQHQPEGPVVLAGYSAGATTAFEMARQVRASGGEVAALILIDSMAPGFGKFFDPSANRSVFDPAGRDLLKLEAKMLVEHGPKLFKAWRNRKDQPVDIADAEKELAPHQRAPQLDRHKRMVKAWFDMARAYQPDSFDGAAHLVMTRPDTLRAKLFAESYPYYGWERYIDAKHITRHYMSTDEHAVIVYGEFAAEMAGIIETAIETMAG